MRKTLYLLDALRTLKVNPLRTGVTLVSLTLGVACLCLLLAIKHGVNQQVGHHNGALGCSVMTVSLHPRKPFAPFIGREHVESLFKKAPFEVVIFDMTSTPVQTSRESLPSRVLSMSLKPATDFRFMPNQFQDTHELVLAGQSLANQSGLEPGDMIWVGNHQHRLYALLGYVPVHPLIDVDFNQWIIRDMPFDEQVRSFWVLYQGELGPVKQTLEDALSATYRDFRYFIKDEASFEAQLKQTIGTYEATLTWFSMIALSFGLLSLVAQLWLAFIERRKECGMRIAIGATYLDLAALFFTESFLLACVGTLMGLALGEMAFKALSQYLGWRYAWSVGLNGLIFTGTVVTCTLAGIIPTMAVIKSQPSELLTSR